MYHKGHIGQSHHHLQLLVSIPCMVNVLSYRVKKNKNKQTKKTFAVKASNLERKKPRKMLRINEQREAKTN